MATSALERLARHALRGVGDPTLGEWVEYGRIAVHVRRRISLAEQFNIGPAVDIRGTAEVGERLAAVRHLLPTEWAER